MSKPKKPILIYPNAPRCGRVLVSEWKPKTAPMTLSIPGRGLVQVTDPGRFALGILMKLENILTGQPEPESDWTWSITEFVDALRALGCEVEIQETGGGSETN